MLSHRPKLLHPLRVVFQLVFAHTLAYVLNSIQEVLQAQRHVNLTLHAADVHDRVLATRQCPAHGHHGCVSTHVRDVSSGVAVCDLHELLPVHVGVQLHATQVDLEQLFSAFVSRQRDVYRKS